ncbi:MAG: CFI-box-CTERM domain-containing protein [Candidatus Brocadiia bacterium]
MSQLRRLSLWLLFVVALWLPANASYASSVIGLTGVDYNGNNAGEINLTATVSNSAPLATGVEFAYRIEDGNWVSIGSDTTALDGFTFVFDTGTTFSWRVYVRARVAPDGVWFQSQSFKSFNSFTSSITGVTSPATGTVQLTTTLPGAAPYVFPASFPEGGANYYFGGTYSYTAQNLITIERGDIFLIRTNFASTSNTPTQFALWAGPGTPSGSALAITSSYNVPGGLQSYPVSFSNVSPGTFVGVTITNGNSGTDKVIYYPYTTGGTSMPSYGMLYYQSGTNWYTYSGASGPAIEFSSKNPYVDPTTVQFGYKDGQTGAWTLIGTGTNTTGNTWTISWNTSGFGSDRAYIGSRVKSGPVWCAWKWQGPYTIVNPAGVTVTNSLGNGKINIDTNDVTVPFSGQWMFLSTHTLIAPLYMNASAASRYRFDNWSNGGSRIQTFKFTMDQPRNYRANYILQYPWTATTSSGTLYGDLTGWYDTNADMRSYVDAVLSSGVGDRFACVGWLGTGSLTDGTTNDTGIFKITMASTVTWLWARQFYLTVITPHGTAYGSLSGWYSEQSTVSSYVDSPVAISADSRWICVGWTGTGAIGDGDVSYSGEFIIDEPTTIIWNWDTQSRMQVTSNYGTAIPATSWYFNGDSVSLTAYSPGNTSEQRFYWQGWTGSDFGTTPSGERTITTTISGPKSFAANWTAEYYLMAVAQNGSFPDGSDYDGWYPDGTYVSITALPPSPEPGVRFVVGWSGSNFPEVTASSSAPNPITILVNGPVSVFSTWVRQFSLQIINPQDVGTPVPDVGTYWYFTGERIRGYTDFRTLGMICTGYIGTGSAVSAGTPYFEFTISEPSTITWRWGAAVVHGAPQWSSSRALATNTGPGMINVQRLSDGSPLVAYYSVGEQALKVAWLQNGVWIVETVYSYAGKIDNATGTLLPGNNIGLAVDEYGVPQVAFYDPATRALMYGIYSGSTWTLTKLDDESDPGVFLDFKIGPGNVPEFAYYAADSGDLVYATLKDNVLSREVVDSVGNVGLYASLALNPQTGDPRIAYYDATNGDLKCATYDGSVWTIQTVETAGDVGVFCAIGVDPSGAPQIAYQMNNGGHSQGLRFAFLLDGAWTIYTLDSTNTTGFGVALAVDEYGDPHVAYHDFTGLNYAYYNGLIWSTTKLEQGDLNGSTSIALDSSNNPAIVFWKGDTLTYLDAKDNTYNGPITVDTFSNATPTDSTGGTESGGGGGCFIATAAFGSLSAVEVLRMTSLRDEVMGGSVCSESAVRLYYLLAPAVADNVRSRAAAKSVVRRLLSELTF